MYKTAFLLAVAWLGIVALGAVSRIFVTQIRPPATVPTVPLAVTAGIDGSVSWQPFPAQAQPLNLADAETPAGTIDGNNAAFTLAHSPAPALSLHLYRNGIRQTAALDYTLNGATITFLTGAIPEPGAILTADYRF